MRVSYNSPWLWAGGIVASVAAAVYVGWGRVRSVEVPQAAEWAHPVSICPGPGVLLGHPVQLLLEHGQLVRVELGPCEGRSAIHLSESPADIDRLRRSEATIDAPQIRGVFERVEVLDTIVDCRAYVEDGNDVEAVTHELLHCLGWDHPKNPPSGHVMHLDYAKIGLGDWRGIR
jgi:hypothetical protein